VAIVLEDARIRVVVVVAPAEGQAQVLGDLAREGRGDGPLVLVLVVVVERVGAGDVGVGEGAGTLVGAVRVGDVGPELQLPGQRGAAAQRERVLLEAVLAQSKVDSPQLTGSVHSPQFSPKFSPQSTVIK